MGAGLTAAAGSYLLELGLDVSRDKIKDAVAEREVRKRLESYLERQSEINEVCSRDEELDFQGIVEYIQHDLIEDARLWMRGSKQERASARERIHSKAITYAQAHTKLSSKRAVKMVDDSMCILRGYYRCRTNSELRFLAAEIEDSVEDAINRSITAHDNEAKRRFEALERKIDNSSGFSIDHNVMLAKQGRIAEVQDNFATAMNALSTTHSLYPHYGYRMNTDNKIVSFPLTKEAQNIFPIHYNITADKAFLGEEPLRALDDVAFIRAYHMQKPIHLEGVKVEKYLGTILDPAQAEAADMTGSHMYLKPPEFPPAAICSVSVNDEVFFPSLLMRLKEILDDQTAIATNEKQENRRFDVTFRMNPTTSHFDFNVHMLKPTNQDLLNYFKFADAVNKGGTIAVKFPQSGEQLLSGKYTGGRKEKYSRIIDILEKILEIEQYFHVSIEVPDKVTASEYEDIDYVYSMIKQIEYRRGWKTFNIELELATESRKNITEMKDAEFGIWLNRTATAEIFGTTIHFCVQRFFPCVKVSNLAKLQEKARILDDGDKIKLTFLPGKHMDNTDYYDCIVDEASPMLYTAQIQ